jgi:hypothetical protein
VSKNGGTVVDWIMQNGQYQSGNVITTARHRVHSQSGGNSDTRSLRRTVFEDTAGKSAVKDQKHGPAIVRSVGVTGPCIGPLIGGRGPIRNRQRSET